MPTLEERLASLRSKITPYEVGDEERDELTQAGEVGMYPGDESLVPQIEKAGRKEFSQIKTDRLALTDQVKKARIQEKQFRDQDSFLGQAKQTFSNIFTPDEVVQPAAPTVAPNVPSPVQPKPLATQPKPAVTAPPMSAPLPVTPAVPGRLPKFSNPDEEESFMSWYSNTFQENNWPRNPHKADFDARQRFLDEQNEESPKDDRLYSSTIQRGTQWGNVMGHDPLTKEEEAGAPFMGGKSYATAEEAAAAAANEAQADYDQQRRDPASSWHNPALTQEQPLEVPEVHVVGERIPQNGPLIFTDKAGNVTRQVPTPDMLVAPAGPPMPKSLGEGLTQATNNFFTGIAQIPADSLKAIAIASKTLDDYVPNALKDDRKIEERLTYKLGNTIDQLAKRLFPTDPEMRKNFIVGVLPQAMGSMVGFMAGGFAGMAAKAPGTTTAILGAGVGGAQQFEEAKDFKASPEVQQKSFWLGSAVGSSEALPIAGLLNRFNKATGGGFIKILKESGVTAAQEFIQEWGQQVGSNAVAQQLYDENRSWFEGAGIAGSAGGVTGMIVGFLSGVLQGRKARKEHHNESAAQSNAPFVGEPAAQPTIDTGMIPDQLHLAQRPPFLIKQQPSMAAPELPPELVPTSQAQAPVLSQDGGRPVPEIIPHDAISQKTIREARERADAIEAYANAEETPLPPSLAPVLESPSQAPAAPAMTPEEIVAGSGPISSQTSTLEGLRDTGSGDAEILGNISESTPFRTQGLRGLDAPSQRLVMEQVFNVAQDPEVRSAIIKSIPVDVVNILRGQQLTPERLLSDKTVFTEFFSGNLDSPISGGFRVADALIESVASASTKSLRGPGSEFAGEGSAALVTDNGTPDELSGMGAGTTTELRRPVTTSFPDKTDVTPDTIVGRQDVTPSSDVELGTEAVRAASVPSILPSSPGSSNPSNRSRASEVSQETAKSKSAELEAYIDSLPQDEAKRAYARALVDGLKSGNLPAEPKNLTGAEIQEIQKGLMDAVASGKVKPSPVTPDNVVDQAAHEAATSPQNEVPTPTEAMQQAGNYRKGHVSIAGLDISIENPQGSTRSGKDANGKPWSVTMKSHYGYIKGTVGKDKDHVDVFIKPGTPEDYSGTVYVVDQVEPKSGKFDEHKIILGSSSIEEAKQLYRENYKKDWNGMGSISSTPMKEFKDWIKSGETKKPFQQKAISQTPDQVAPSRAEVAPTPEQLPSPSPTPVMTPGEPVSPVPRGTRERKSNRPKPLTMAETTRTDKVKPILSVYDGLPQRTRDRFDAAWEGAAKGERPAMRELKEWLYPNNKTLRTEFERRSGVTLPNGLATTNAAVEAYFSKPKEETTVSQVEPVTPPAESTPVPPKEEPASTEAEPPDDPQTLVSNALAGAFRAAADAIAKATTPAAKANVDPDTAMTGLEDAGQKIGGARKDRWATRGLTLDDLAEMSGGEESKFVTKANIWKPDYTTMVQSGADPKAVALVKIVYDRLAAKPKADTAEGRRQYVEMMGYVKDAYASVKTLDDVKQARQSLLKHASLENVPGLSPVYASVFKDRSEPFYMDFVAQRRASKMVAEGFPTQEPWTRRYAITDYGGPNLTKEGQEYYEKKGGPWAVVEKSSKRILAYKPDEASAKAEAQRLYEYKSDETEKGRGPERPHLDDLKRSGTDYRNGTHVTAEDFREQFGFRGIEFGNYAASDERQKHVDQAYDALMDLATLLGLPPKAISLNATLGLAFGARGSGKAKAHYEPSKLVINITKVNGPGALAHEWGHALDHYFGELDRPDAYQGAPKGASGWMQLGKYTGAPERRYTKTGMEEVQRLPNLRPEMRRALDRVMDALFHRSRTKAEAVRDAELNLEKLQGLIAKYEQDIAKTKEKTSTPPDKITVSWLKQAEDYLKSLTIRRDVAGKMLAKLTDGKEPDGGYGRVETSFYQQAQVLSGPTGDYWKRPTEMFARAFESYVFDRLGTESQYLVHSVESDRYTKEHGYKGNPYPEGTERDAIHVAFNGLVDTIESKATDQGIALFEKRKMVTGEPSYADMRRAFRDAMPIGGEDLLRLTDTSQQYPPELLKAMSEQPTTHRLVREVSTVFTALQQKLAAIDPVFKNVIFAGFSPDDYYLGVNAKGPSMYPGKQHVPDVIVVNPWAMAWTTRRALQLNHVTPAMAEWYTAQQMVDTMLHELTHQQVETTHEDSREPAFQYFLNKNYATVGRPAYLSLVNTLHATLKESSHAATRYADILKDLRAIEPFWRGGPALSLQAGSGNAVHSRTGNRQNVAGEGATGRTGPPRTVRSRRATENAAVGKGPAFQRRDPDESVANPQYRQEAEAYLRQRATEDNTPGQTGTITPSLARGRLASAAVSVRPLLLGSLGLHQLAMVYGKDHHEVADYNKASQQMEADFTAMTRDSDAVLKQWDKLDRATSDGMARVMEEARLENYDPDPEPSIYHAPSFPVMPKEIALRQVFNQLPDDVKAVYRTVRDYYSEMADDRFEAIRGRIERSGGTPENRRALLDRLEVAYEKVRAKVYFPFTRFGEHLVIARKMRDGKEVDRVVSAFESPREAATVAERMRRDGWTVKQTMAKEYSQDKQGGASKVVREILDVIDGITDDPAIDGTTPSKQHLKDAINQAFLQALPDLSYAKHFIHAKDVKGFSKDAIRAFAHSALHGAHHISRINNADFLTKALLSLDERINETTEGDTTEARQVYNELVKRHNEILNPNTSPVAAWLGKLGFTMSLAGSVATGLTNATQVPLVTYPWLGARYGFAKASAALARGYKDFLDPRTLNTDSLFDASQSAKISEEDRAMLRELQQRGRIDLTQTMDLTGRASQDNLSRVARQHGSLQEKISKVLGFTFHAPEVMNRQVTALATYRMARAAGRDQDEAIHDAEQAIIETHFVYTAENRPRFMSGNVLRVLTMFKQYGQNIAFLYGRAAQIALTKTQATPAEKRVALKQLTMMLGLQFGAAGALGLPFVGSVASLFTALVNGFKDDDDEIDWEIELRKSLADLLGQKGGEVAAHGLSRLTPWDMAGRLGQSDLFFRAPKREREGRAAFMDWVTSFSGPVLGYATNAYLGTGDVVKGIKDADAGHFLRGVEELTPAFTRNVVKAFRYQLEGGVRTRDDYKQLDVNSAEKLGQFFGFTPSRVAEMYESVTAIKNAEQRLTGRRKDVLDQYAAAYQQKDPEAMRKATEEVKAFNEKHPEIRITDKTLKRSYSGRLQHAQQTKDGLYLPKTREFLRSEGAFGDVESEVTPDKIVPSDAERKREKKRKLREFDAELKRYGLGSKPRPSPVPHELMP